MNVDRILLLAREYASAYSLKDQSEVSRTWMNLKRALQEAAAPQQAEPVGEVRSETCHYSMMPDRICNKCGRVHGYSHPTAAPQRAEPALNERVGLAYKNGYEEALNDCIRNGGEAWARSMFANGGEHIKPQQAEPVAWMAFGGALVHAVTRNAMDPIEAERFDVPLYLHPPAAPQQAEPVAWVEVLDRDEGPYEFHGQKLLPRGKHSLYLHPPAAEVQRLRDALEQIEREANQPYIQRIAAAALKVGE